MQAEGSISPKLPENVICYIHGYVACSSPFYSDLPYFCFVYVLIIFLSPSLLSLTPFLLFFLIFLYFLSFFLLPTFLPFRFPALFIETNLHPSHGYKAFLQAKGGIMSAT